MRAEVNLVALQGELERLLAALGYELVRMRYHSGAGGGHLELLIDKPGGVTVGDCAGVSHQVGAYLDVVDPFPRRYTLEVSSPGVNRPLTKDEHLKAALGHRVTLRLTGEEGGSRRLEGILRGVEEDALEVEVKGRNLSIPRERIQESRLVYEWDEGRDNLRKGSSVHGAKGQADREEAGHHRDRAARPGAPQFDSAHRIPSRERGSRWQ